MAEEMGYLLHWFRDILVFKSGLPASFMLNTDRLEQIGLWAKCNDSQQLEIILAKIIEADKLINQNVNPKIALGVMLLEIERCKKSF